MRTPEPILSVVCAGFLLAVGVASACTCNDTPTPQEAFDESDAVFSGTVLSTAVVDVQGNAMVRVTFQVLDCWKGALGDVAEVWTEDSGAECGFEFFESTDYLVYAFDFANLGLWTHLCTRNRNLAFAQEDLDFLGSPGSCDPVSVNRATWGTVKSVYRD